MSYSYTVNERRRRTANTGSYGYSGNRSAFGYWVPLALTVTAATVGLVAWIWSERRDDEEESEGEQYSGGGPPPGYNNMSGGLPTGPAPSDFQGPPGSMPMSGPPQDGGYQQYPPGPMGGPPQQGGFQGPPPGGMGGPPMQGGFRGPEGGSENTETFAARSTGVEQQDDTGLVARMSSALGMGRTSSPGQSYDWASKKLTAGVAAAGAMVGLNSIKEDSRDDYQDHEQWSEVADKRDTTIEPKMGVKRTGTADEFFSGSIELPKKTSLGNQKRKTVAIVVSSAQSAADTNMDVGHHASILSHLPEYVEPDTTRVFVLIYAPELKAHPLSPTATRRASQSMTSSFSNISQTEAHTPGDFPAEQEGILANVDPNPIDDSSTLYKTLHNQAILLVDRDSMVLPFTSSSGHKHLLRSLAPEVVYIQESLCGPDGEVVQDLSGWVKQTVVVIGDEGGHGGLIDTDDEGEHSKTGGETWWQKEERTGLGKRVGVVESVKIGDDWRRRVGEHD